MSEKDKLLAQLVAVINQNEANMLMADILQATAELLARVLTEIDSEDVFRSTALVTLHITSVVFAEMEKRENKDTNN